MKRKTDIVFFILVMIMLLLPLSLTKTAVGAISNVDGRKLAEMPLVGSNGYTKGMESWLRDRLGLRDAIVSIYTAANDVLFYELISPTYQYGKDGYTFFKIHNNIEYGDYQRQFAEMVADMQNYCESRGTRFYYVFNPEKESVYRSLLPAGVNYDDDWVDRMLSYMDMLGVNCIDLRKVLAEENDRKDVFDRKNDAGHWNQNGAFCGMREITRHIHKDIPQVSVLEEKEYNITSRTVEKLVDSNHILNESVPVYTLKAGYTDITGDYVTELVRSKSYPYFQLVKNASKEAKGIKRLLLFEDDLYAPFAFSRSGETMIMTCLQNAVNFDYYYNVYDPDVVIFESMEYVVQNNNFSQSVMEVAEHNPAVIKNYPEEEFEERRDQLLDQTRQFYTEASAVLIPGKAVDRVFISEGLDNARYAYLITDDRTIDLKADEQGLLTASVRHGDLKEGSYVTLYTLSKNNDGQYAVIPVTDKMRNIAVKEFVTDNVTCENRKYNMANSVDGDVFTYNAIHLYDSNSSEYLIGIGASGTAGTVEGGYCHKLPTGDYMLFLRAGSRNTSESVAYRVHLVEGQSYWFTYTVEEFSGKKAVFSDFSFSKPVEVSTEDPESE